MRVLSVGLLLAATLVAGCSGNAPASGGQGAPSQASAGNVGDFTQEACSFSERPLGTVEERQALGRSAAELIQKYDGRVSVAQADADLLPLLAALPTLAVVPPGQDFTSGATLPPLPGGRPNPQNLEAALDAIRDVCT